MPNLKIKACVLDGAGSEDVCTWLVKYAGVSIVETPQDADIVVFTGGSDVTPSRYGEQNIASQCDWLRDAHEHEIFEYCRAHGIPMFGICRGSQFLHTEMGGKLWQDVDNHCCTHDLIDLDANVIVKDTCSTHHQMVRMAWTNCLDAEDNGFMLVATPDKPRSTGYRSADGFLSYDDDLAVCDNMHLLTHDELNAGPEGQHHVAEVEAYRYDKASIMGIQGHPEWGGEEFAIWGATQFLDHVARRDAVVDDVVAEFGREAELQGAIARENEAEVEAMGTPLADAELRRCLADIGVRQVPDDTPFGGDQMVIPMFGSNGMRKVALDPQ